MHLSRELIAPVLERNQACVAKYEWILRLIY
jgi:hypothetical protein